MHSNRTRSERERGWLGCWMRGGLVVGVLFCSGVGARGYLVAEPAETWVFDESEQDLIEVPPGDGRTDWDEWMRRLHRSWVIGIQSAIRERSGVDSPLAIHEDCRVREEGAR